MDRAIGSVLEQLGSDDDLLLVTDRGMFADYRAIISFERVLLGLELAVQRGPSHENRTETWRTRLLTQRDTRKALRFIGQKLLPEPVRQALLPFHRAAVGESAPLDWRKTRVYAMPAVGNSHLRINLAGREPLGLVTPARAVSQRVGRNTAQLRALINPATGERAVEELYFPSTQLQDLAPPSFLTCHCLESELPINALSSQASYDQRASHRRTYRNHRPDGFALFSGPSYSTRGCIANGDPRQIAPAILSHSASPRPPL